MPCESYELCYLLIAHRETRDHYFVAIRKEVFYSLTGFPELWIVVDRVYLRKELLYFHAFF